MVHLKDCLVQLYLQQVFVVTVKDISVVDVSKSEYKAFLVILKYIPFLLAGLYLINVILDMLCFGTMWITISAGIGFIPACFIIYVSYLFRYCSYHRMPLYYIMLNNLINWFIYAIDFNVSMCFFFSWFIIITAIFCIATTILYKRSKDEAFTNNKRRTPKDN
jgi:hypothetical protein